MSFQFNPPEGFEAESFDFGPNPTFDFNFAGSPPSNEGSPPAFDFANLNLAVQNMSLDSPSMVSYLPIPLDKPIVQRKHHHHQQQQNVPVGNSLKGEWNIVRLLEGNSPLLVELHVLPYDSLSEVAFALPGNTCLEELDCSLALPEEFTAVAAALAHATKALKRLSVDWPRLVLNYENVMGKAEQALADSLVMNQGITDLKIRSSNAVFRAIMDNKRLERVTVESGSAGDVTLLASAAHLKYLRIGWGNSASLNGFVEGLIKEARDSALEELDLCSPGGKYDGKELSRFLQISERIRSLTLRGNYGPANQIHEGIRLNRNLTSLAIHSLNTDDRCEHSLLCSAIGTHPTLRSVELRNVFVISLEDVSKLICAPSLRVLRVVRCGIWDSTNVDEAELSWEMICTAAESNSGFEELDLSSNELTPNFCKLFRRVPNVTRLMMGRMCFSAEGLLALAEGLKSAKKIQTLDISQAKGPIEDVLNSLAFLPYLRVLNLSDLHVHPTYSREPFSPNLPYGVPCELFTPLIARGLRKLDLHFCFNIQNFDALVKALLSPGVALRYLDLSSMEIKEKRVKKQSSPGVEVDVVNSICQLIVHNKTIETLRLCNVHFESDHMERIAVALGQNRTITHFACYGYDTPTPAELENVSDALVANLPRTVVQELEIGSKQSGFTRALLSAIDASPYLHHVHVVAPESFEADFLLEARHKLRWKENVARVQRNCVRDAINTWLLMAKRPSLVRMIGKDMRHMIAGYIWRIRFEWPLPIAPGRELTDSTNETVETQSEMWQTIFVPPEIPAPPPEEKPTTPIVRRILKTKNRTRTAGNGEE